MSNKKKSFLLHIDSLDILDDLTNGQAGVLFKAIKAYQHNEEFPLDSVVKIAFSPFKNQFFRDDEKYTKTCESRAIAGSKGGKQKVANASKCLQSVANVADTKNKNKNKTKNNNEVTRRFTPPSIEEVSQYCKERKNNIDANNFINYYSTNGWMRGKNKIKDWKACVRTWEGNSINSPSKTQSPKEFSQ